MAALIEARRIVKVYHTGPTSLYALRGITLSIEPGRLCLLMGPSGSGKSTFLNVMGCLDQPTSGQYLLDGIDVGRLSRNELAAVRNNKIGFVFQNFNLLPRTTAVDNVVLPMLYRRGPTFRSPEAGACRSEDGRTAGPCEPPSQPAFRRAATARRDCASTGEPSRHHSGRRTDGCRWIRAPASRS